MLVAMWFPLATSCLIVSLLLLHNLSKVKNGSTLLAMQAKEMLPKNGYQFYAALPQVLGSFSVALAKEDARPEILRQFLREHQSPMEPYTDLFVETADANQLDFRLIPAIGMCESNLGKKIPEGSYNFSGYAIYTGESAGAAFKSWEESIKVMGAYLATRYYANGLVTPLEIGPIYAPPSVNTGNSWANCVQKFMDELL